MNYGRLTSIVLLTLPSIGWLYLLDYAMKKNDLGTALITVAAVVPVAFCQIGAFAMVATTGAEKLKKKGAPGTRVELMVLGAIFLIGMLPFLLMRCW